MRFQKGMCNPYHRVPRGPGRGDPPYRMSHAAYQARLRNLAHWSRPRTPLETQRLRVEIALGTLRGEKSRKMARRLGCSHVYCRKVARPYHAGRVPFLPANEESLLAMKESLNLRDKMADTALAEPASANMGVEATFHPSNPYRVMAHARTLHEWQELERRGRR